MRRRGMGNFLNRFLRDKRALTPVLSSLLLTVIAVGGMAIATSTTFIITTNMKETMSERIVAEDIWFNTATNTIDVYLSNIGKVDIHISNIYVNHTSQPYNSPFNLNVNGHDWMTIFIDWNSGDLYYVDIVTNRGTHIADTYRAP
jgi:FlaG/FlaF family flagellin (archaellin)